MDKCNKYLLFPARVWLCSHFFFFESMQWARKGAEMDRNVGCGITYLISTLPVKFLGKENYWKRNTLYRNLFLFFPPGNRAEALAVRTTKPCKGLSVLRQEGNGSRCCLSCLLPHAFYSCPFIFRGSIIIWTPVTVSLLIAIQAQQLNET